MDKFSASFVRGIYEGTPVGDPLAVFDDFSSAGDIRISPGGAVCLMAYWIFSRDVFDADQPEPDMFIFPDHLAITERFLGMEAESEIRQNPGIADAVLTIGLGLQRRNQVFSGPDQASVFMAYHHHLTLMSVFHPDLRTRNAATVFAGSILHADPDDENRLEILEDLLENCMFGSLKACAVTWLKEELVAARTQQLANPFATADVIDRLQYSIFPDMLAVRDMSADALLEYWAQNHAFLIQVANFARFLFTGYRDLAPPTTAAAVEQRFVEPLLAAAEGLLGAEAGAEDKGAQTAQLAVLVDRLKSLPLHE